MRPGRDPEPEDPDDEDSKDDESVALVLDLCPAPKPEVSALGATGAAGETAAPPRGALPATGVASGVAPPTTVLPARDGRGA